MFSYEDRHGRDLTTWPYTLDLCKDGACLFSYQTEFCTRDFVSAGEHGQELPLEAECKGQV